MRLQLLHTGSSVVTFNVTFNIGFKVAFNNTFNAMLYGIK